MGKWGLSETLEFAGKLPHHRAVVKVRKYERLERNVVSVEIGLSNLVIALN